MSNINLSLDEIIAKTKIRKMPFGAKPFKTAKINGSKFGGVEKGGKTGFKNGGVFAKVKAVPSIRKHNVAVAHKSFSTSEPKTVVNDKIRMNISNLAATVTTADLKELFSSYTINSAFVHYDQNGIHLGTGEVAMKKTDAQRALNDLKGLAIDGSRVRFALVDGASDRVKMVKKVTGGIIQKRSRCPIPQTLQAVRTISGLRSPVGRKTGKMSFKAIKGDRSAPKAKTEEELNAELDEYMKKSEN